jgi:hypothetical protein
MISMLMWVHVHVHVSAWMCRGVTDMERCLRQLLAAGLESHGCCKFDKACICMWPHQTLGNSTLLKYVKA